MATADNRVSWVFTTKSEYLSKPKDDLTIYFLMDVLQIYKGSTRVADPIVFTEEELPAVDAEIATNKIYVKIPELSCHTWDGTKWNNIVRAVTDNIIGISEADIQKTPTANAVLLYIADRISKMLSTGEIKGENVKLENNITVVGANAGKYVPGDIISAGTSLSAILSNLVKTRIPPIYEEPEFSIPKTEYIDESGTLIKPTILPVFIKNDAGPVDMYTIIKTNGNNPPETVLNTPQLQEYVEAAMETLPDNELLKYNISLHYTDGEIKADNFDQYYPTERIKAGYKTGTVKYIGYRNAFFGADTLTVEPETSDDIRGLASKLLNPNNGDSMAVIVPIDSRRIIIAYPDRIKELESIIDSSSGFNVLGNFTKSLIWVEGANGYDPMAYKVYTYISTIPFPQLTKYIATIKKEDN